MTILEPSRSDDELLNNNYRGNPKYSDRTECAFAMSKCDVPARQISDRYGRDVWRCDRDIHLEEVEFYVINRTGRSLYV